MPPRLNSRFEFCRGIANGRGRTVLTERVPYRFQNLADNRVHTVREGDDLFSLAGLYFRPKGKASLYWWVIADFQPTPIFDPTIELVAGSVVYIPSLRTLDERILSSRRRRLF